MLRWVYVTERAHVKEWQDQAAGVLDAQQSGAAGGGWSSGEVEERWKVWMRQSSHSRKVLPFLPGFAKEINQKETLKRTLCSGVHLHWPQKGACSELARCSVVSRWEEDGRTGGRGQPASPQDMGRGARPSPWSPDPPLLSGPTAASVLGTILTGCGISSQLELKQWWG